MSFWRGYVPTKNKQSTMKYANGEPLLTYNEVKDLPEFAGLIAHDSILVDIDDMVQANILLDIIDDLQIKCLVLESRSGMHFLFKNKSSFAKSPTKTKLACGLVADIKSGLKNGYEVLKIDDKEREVLYDKLPEEEYDTLPKWLLPINHIPDFDKLGTGDGRNQEFFNYILKLQSNGFDKEECRKCIRIINKYILKTPLTDKELDVILRDDAFNAPIFFEDKKFLFDKFAQYLKSEYHIIKINNQLHVYNNGVYDYANKTIEAKMIERIPTLKSQQRVEVMKYLELICEDKEQSEANYIAFKNGIYDISTDTMLPYSPDIILTNRIEHNYNPQAYNALMDTTLNKIACGDIDVRALLEECIGYNFYRRAELGRAFILTGDKANGKSTFLDLIKYTLGEKNISALDLRELGDRFNTAMIFGKLANIGDDIGDEFLQGNAVSIFKKIVTGNRVKAELKGKDPFEFNPYVKLLFSANDMPRMRDKTGAVLRRLVMIPFNATFTKDDPDYDPYIKYKLIKEDAIEYMIAIGIEGLKRVLMNSDFTTPTSVQKALADYEEENNPVIAFINDVGEDAISDHPTQDVYLRYTTFCAENQLQALSKIAFSKQITKRLRVVTANRRINGKLVRLFVEV